MTAHWGIPDPTEVYDAPMGASYAHWAGLDDPVIEINLAPILLAGGFGPATKGLLPEKPPATSKEEAAK
jgi:hypothetical protein